MSKDISYQNKDILFKILSEQYKSKSFSAYGLNIPPIKALLPTNLPKITANEKSTDNLFLLALKPIVSPGAIVASDKFIQPEYREQLRRLLGMTWLSEMYEKEKIEYGKQVAAQEKKKMAISLLNKDADIVMIMEVTGLSEKEILSLKEEPVTA